MELVAQDVQHCRAVFTASGSETTVGSREKERQSRPPRPLASSSRRALVQGRMQPSSQVIGLLVQVGAFCMRSPVRLDMALNPLPVE